MIHRERLAFGSHVHPSVPARASVIAAELSHEPSPVRLTRLETWDWGWGGLLLFTILLFFRPQDQIPGFQNAHLSDMAALIGLCGMLFTNLSRRNPILRLNPELLGVVALALVILATIPTSWWPGGAFDAFQNNFIPITFGFVLIVNCVTSPKRIERICWVIVLAFGYFSIWVILNYVRGVNLVEGNRAAGPVDGFFENPNDLALNLASFLPIALIFVRRPGPPLRRMLCAGISLLMLVVVILTKSRGGLLGTVAMLATFLLVSRSLGPATLIALVLGGILILPALPESFWARMASITDAEKDPTGSREERKQLLQEGWQVFLDHPLTGVGMEQFQNLDLGGVKRWRETHNALLQVAAELGICGVAVFVFLIGRTLTAAFWTQRRLSWIYRKRTRPRGVSVEPEDGLDDDERVFLQTHGAAMVACTVGWFVSALFASVAFNWTFYYVLGLAVCGRDVVRARAKAYARLKKVARQEQRAIA